MTGLISKVWSAPGKIFNLPEGVIVPPVFGVAEAAIVIGAEKAVADRAKEKRTATVKMIFIFLIFVLLVLNG
jgi:hypothetical protein